MQGLVCFWGPAVPTLTCRVSLGLGVEGSQDRQQAWGELEVHLPNQRSEPVASLKTGPQGSLLHFPDLLPPSGCLSPTVTCRGGLLVLSLGGHPGWNPSDNIKRKAPQLWGPAT